VGRRRAPPRDPLIIRRRTNAGCSKPTRSVGRRFPERSGQGISGDHPVHWTAMLEGFAAALIIATVTAPVGVSGAVSLLPVQLNLLHLPNPSVTPTNLMYNVTPGQVHWSGTAAPDGSPVPSPASSSWARCRASSPVPRGRRLISRIVEKLTLVEKGGLTRPFERGAGDGNRTRIVSLGTILPRARPGSIPVKRRRAWPWLGHIHPDRPPRGARGGHAPYWPGDSSAVASVSLCWRSISSTLKRRRGSTSARL
jgi:hypothetical protein